MTTRIFSGYAVTFNDSGTQLTSFDTASLEIVTTEGISGYSYSIDSSQAGYLPVISLDLDGVQISIDGVLLSDMQVEIRLGEVAWGGGNSTVLMNFETPDGLVYSFDLAGDPVSASSQGAYQSFLSSIVAVGPATGDFGPGMPLPLDRTLSFRLENDDWYGSLEADSWDGGTGDDSLFARGGDDLVRGGDGDDHLRGSRGFDELYGDDGEDLITGGGQGDEIHGGRDDDVLRGGRGQDEITGNGGNDEIDGGPGRDVLTGGLGGDIFVFEGNIDRDVITDFGVGNDTLQIDEDIWGGGLTAQQVIDTYGTTDGDGNFVLDFSGGDTSPAADAIVFEGIADGAEIVDSIELI